MKKYLNPKMEISHFSFESIITTSQLNTWQSENNATILNERNFERMTELTKIVF